MKPANRISVVVVLVALAVGATAQKKEKPIPCVTLAKSWEAAVEEAKLLNVPIVVHSHGFYCPPCWGMHASVMGNKKYIRLAEKNTVEVCCVSRLEEGIQKGDRKAGTYEVKGPDGQARQYLVHWPGLTVEEMLAMARSPAGRYNNTGKVPYTCIVDPHTLKEVQHWSGSTSAKTIMTEIEAARKALVQQHGPGVSRQVLARFTEAETEIPALIEAGDFAEAVKTLEKATGRGNPPEALMPRLQAAQQKISDAARARLAAVRTQAGSDAKAARAALVKLMRNLRGTGLEKDARELLAELKNSDGA